eukprot:14615954-Alexandrium_andersonii.AAC.1
MCIRDSSYANSSSLRSNNPPRRRSKNKSPLVRRVGAARPNIPAHLFYPPTAARAVRQACL